MPPDNSKKKVGLLIILIPVTYNADLNQFLQVLLMGKSGQYSSYHFRS
jgi:hypothetical protein